MAGVERGDQRGGCSSRVTGASSVAERTDHGLVRVEWSGMPISEGVKDAITRAVAASNAAGRPSTLVRASERER